ARPFRPVVRGRRVGRRTGDHPVRTARARRRAFPLPRRRRHPRRPRQRGQPDPAARVPHHPQRQHRRRRGVAAHLQGRNGLLREVPARAPRRRRRMVRARGRRAQDRRSRLTDLFLAIAHHLLVFALTAMLVAEAVLLRGQLDAGVLRRLAGLDAGYGISALLLLAVGLGRVFFGVMGKDFYLHNPWFHAKLGVFILVGLMSILPTVRFLRWRKALRADPGFLPAPSELDRLRTILRLELIGLAAIFALAAAMARYGGL